MNAVDFIKYLTLHVGKKKNMVIVAGAVNGICMTALMYSLQIGINEVAFSGKLSIRGLLLFICAWIAFYITQLFAIRTSSGAAYSAIEEVELRLINKLRIIDYPAFKTISTADIYAAIGGDKNSVITAARLVITAFSGAISVAVAIFYMGSLSMTAVILIICEYALMIFIYQVKNKSLEKRFEADAKLLSVFMNSLEDLVNGFAELKMNNRKSEDFYNNKVKPASNLKTASFKETGDHWVTMLVVNQVALFIPLGLIVFIVPAMSTISPQSLVEILTITLIIIAPASQVASFVSATDMANNTLLKIWNIEKQLDEAGAASSGEEGSSKDELAVLPEPLDFSVLKIDRLKYTYPDAGSGFTLTVRDFHLNKGEVVIIKGGNGSGKSTFMRLVAGLLLPHEGEITVDGVNASSMKSTEYRSLFSIIFSDFHLFDDFYGFNTDRYEIDYWVKRLGLTEQFRNYANCDKLPTTSLSTGQRKRMALLNVVLEKKKVLLLDEVAADFDPEFRARYYREIIPELKAAGRTLLLVSHDDRYFDVADRVLEFREGTNV
ncbi:MAG: ATP-binding cassette domain-containing protein [Treponema sp.]|jgi:putative ATP-binding cassette transporter|nr:ATP-binding cassette domain-containing protein [Treponema sp.]